MTHLLAPETRSASRRNHAQVVADGQCARALCGLAVVQNVNAVGAKLPIVVTVRLLAFECL